MRIATLLGCLLAVTTAFAEPPKGKRYTLVVESVTVEPLRDGEFYWDNALTERGKRPDPFVIVKREDAELEKQVAELDNKHEQRVDALKEKYAKDKNAFAWSDALERDSQAKTIDARRKAVTAKFMRETPHADDTVTYKFNYSTITVAIGDKVKIHVMDRDLAAHDTMGTQDIEIDEKALAGLDLEFGHVKSLKIKFKP